MKKNYKKRIETLEKMFGEERLGELFRHISGAYDSLFRLQGGQLGNFLGWMERERKRTDDFSNIKSLANDQLGYDSIRVLAVLTHPCQKCAEDPEAWHTRIAFCEHED